MTAPPPYKRIASGAQWWGLIDGLTRWNRYPRDARDLDAVADEAMLSLTTVPVDSVLYRARQMPPSDPAHAAAPFALELMGAPPPAIASGGRLNPPGIPYLYLAESEDTAVAEMRPTRNARYTVARFRALVPLTVFDLASNRPPAEFLNRRLAELFATPAVPDSQHSYAASQIIAERLKATVTPFVHGIRYRSAMRDGGANIALFGGWKRDFATFVAPTERRIVKVKSVEVVHAEQSQWA